MRVFLRNASDFLNATYSRCSFMPIHFHLRSISPLSCPGKSPHCFDGRGIDRSAADRFDAPFRAGLDFATTFR